MWVKVCDNCQSIQVTMGRQRDQPGRWIVEVETALQDADVHACSRECAATIDDEQTQGEAK